MTDYLEIARSVADAGELATDSQRRHSTLMATLALHELHVEAAVKLAEQGRKLYELLDERLPQPTEPTEPTAEVADQRFLSAVPLAHMLPNPPTLLAPSLDQLDVIDPPLTFQTGALALEDVSIDDETGLASGKLTQLGHVVSTLYALPDGTAATLRAQLQRGALYEPPRSDDVGALDTVAWIVEGAQREATNHAGNAATLARLYAWALDSIGQIAGAKPNGGD